MKKLRPRFTGMFIGIFVVCVACGEESKKHRSTPPAHVAASKLAGKSWVASILNYRNGLWSQVISFPQTSQTTGEALVQFFFDDDLQAEGKSAYSVTDEKQDVILNLSQAKVVFDTFLPDDKIFLPYDETHRLLEISDTRFKSKPNKTSVVIATAYFGSAFKPVDGADEATLEFKTLDLTDKDVPWRNCATSPDLKQNGFCQIPIAKGRSCEAAQSYGLITKTDLTRKLSEQELAEGSWITFAHSKSVYRCQNIDQDAVVEDVAR